MFFMCSGYTRYRAALGKGFGVVFGFSCQRHVYSLGKIEKKEVYERGTQIEKIYLFPSNHAAYKRVHKLPHITTE